MGRGGKPASLPGQGDLSKVRDAGLENCQPRRGWGKNPGRGPVAQGEQGQPVTPPEVKGSQSELVKPAQEDRWAFSPLNAKGSHGKI